MIHRDIKSPNILLTREGVAKIGDVGMMHMQVSLQPLMPARIVLAWPRWKSSTFKRPFSWEHGDQAG